MSSETLRDNALEYHRYPRPGKIEVVATKPLANQRDLALAYSPGVAAACEEIVADPARAADYTSRANLVAVVTNGTAVLGLGAIGPLASKPVMEGKAVLFKKFAGIDAIDIEIDERDAGRLVDIVAALEPSFGAINLEDIKAPECFEVEAALRERMKIPVFHDDQHGTAIIVAAAALNGLRLQGKRLEDVRLVTAGAGAAALACLDLLVALGLPRENITATDIAGVVYAGRTEQMDPWKARYAQDTSARTLAEAIRGADVFLGLSAPRIVTPEMLKTMAERPLVLALANPDPEILPELAKEARPDAIIATGRSDYPNQVNNVLCFPYIFRGALDVGATQINEAMKVAAAHALAGLAQAEASDVVMTAYGIDSLGFGPDYIIPKPFDPRLIVEVSSAVARAAMESGVATRPIEDFGTYRRRLSEYVWRSGLVMRPIFDHARREPKRLVYTDGEDERVLRAVQIVLDEGFAQTIVIGRPEVVQMRLERLGLRMRPDRDFELVNPESDPRYRDYVADYHRLMERSGVTPDAARTIVRTSTTVIGALMVRRGEADAMLAGPEGRYERHLHHILSILGLREGVISPSALQVLILDSGVVFLTDTYVTYDPSPAEIAESAVLAAEEIRRFGIVPKVALLSHSNFGSSDTPTARKMREALEIIRRYDPHLEVEGEMHADAALSERIRARIFPNSRLKGEANLLVLPTLDAANIAFNMVKVLGEGQPVGPVLIGPAQPAHILTPSVTVRGIINMSALTVVDAQARAVEAPWCAIPVQAAK